MNRTYLKLIIAPVLIGFSFNASAGGMMKSGGPSEYAIFLALFLILIGIPLIGGIIASTACETGKKRFFFLGFFITMAITVMASILYFIFKD